MKRMKFFVPLVAIVSVVTVFGFTQGARTPSVARQPQQASDAGDIYLSDRVGAVEEHVLRDQNTAVHIYMDTAKDPYLFFAFPAGNSGTGIWFKTATNGATLQAIARPTTLREGNLHGAQIDIRSSAQELTIDDTILGSMRFVRDRELKGIVELPTPPEVHDQAISVAGNHVQIIRQSLNGLAEYQLNIEALGDTRIEPSGNTYRFVSPTQVEMRVTGMTGEVPLTAVNAANLFKPESFAKIEAKKRQMLAFLVYKEKILAGSPRYDSEFGRDSIFSVDALFEDLKPEAIENLLMANLNGMNPQTGEISHERNEGDFACHERMLHNLPYKGVICIVEDYKMVDDNFAFAQLVKKYLTRFPQREDAFLHRQDARGLTVRDLLQRNFDLIENQTAPFVISSTYKNLISFKPGQDTGDWRDSKEGNAKGHRTFNVNAVLAPAALKALADLYANEKSAFYNAGRAQKLAAAFQVWNHDAIKLFAMHITGKNLFAYAQRFMKSLGKNPSALPAPPGNGLDFFALAIDDSGQKIPIIHSDDSLMMMWGEPSPEYLATISQRINLPFPYGLHTPVGLVISNPVLAPPKLQESFGPRKYHGSVIWTVQEDLMQLGLERQLLRKDLSAALKTVLAKAETEIRSLRTRRNFKGAAEILMIDTQQGREVAVPFSGNAKGNSNQLWSHLLDTRQDFPATAERQGGGI